jgi:carboxypeptidase Taq
MGTNYDALMAHMAEVCGLRQASSLLNWDRETNMPSGAIESRSEQMAILSKLEHVMFTSPQTGKLLRLAAKEDVVHANADSDEAAIVRVTLRDYKRSRKVPAEFVAEVERTRAQSHHAWVQARKASDFALFEPWLSKMIDLTRRYADFLGYKDHPYDALLEGFEPGMKSSHVRAIFADLREQLVPLARAISAKADAVSDAPVRRHFPREQQIAFATQLIKHIGYDMAHGRMDMAAHPFCTSASSQDVRITTRVDENFLNMMLFSAAHESGHAMYEQGISPAFARTLLENGASLGMHESQSRMWENLVGRSREFWQFFYPHAQAAFPAALGDVPLDDFHRAINRVNPSFIRVEADEVTYNLHIMVRFELEMELLENKLQAADLPAAWNARYQEYLGITPPNDALGVLQDTHWAIGLIGYFPTYSLGNLISVQLFEKAEQDTPGLRDGFANGDFAPLLSWLRQNVHVYGRKYTPDELIKRATGRKLSAKPYVKYLQRKYKKIYGL